MTKTKWCRSAASLLLTVVLGVGCVVLARPSENRASAESVQIVQDDLVDFTTGSLYLISPLPNSTIERQKGYSYYFDINFVSSRAESPYMSLPVNGLTVGVYRLIYSFSSAGLPQSGDVWKNLYDELSFIVYLRGGSDTEIAGVFHFDIENAEQSEYPVKGYIEYEITSEDVANHTDIDFNIQWSSMVQQTRGVRFLFDELRVVRVATCYDVTFNYLNEAGQPASETQQVIAGESFTVPELPAIDKKIFTGWDKSTSNTIPTGDITYTAQYTNQHDVTFNYLTAPTESTAYTYRVNEGTTITDIPTPPAVEGKEFQGWDSPPEGVTVGADMVFNAVYRDLAQYDIVFKYLAGDGTENEYSYKLYEGETVRVFPKLPTIRGKTFAGWDRETEGVIISGALTFTAIYTDIPQHAVIFSYYDDTGQAYEYRYQLYEGESVTDVPTPPAVRGKTFLGWDSDPAGAVLGTADMTFAAQYEDIPVFTVTFVYFGADGRETSYSYELYRGEVVTDIPAVQDIKHHKFIRWDIRPEGVTVQADLTFTAVYDSTYDVVFYYLDGNGVEISYIYQVKQNTLLTEFPVLPVVRGKRFTGWDKTTTGVIVDKDMAFIAQYEQLTAYTVTFEYLDTTGVYVEKELTYYEGEKLGGIPIPPKVTGKTFTGWDSETAGVIVSRDMRFTAQYEDIKDVKPNEAEQGGNWLQRLGNSVIALGEPWSYMVFIGVGVVVLAVALGFVVLIIDLFRRMFGVSYRRRRRR